MLTRVVVVAFALSMMVCARTDGQATPATTPATPATQLIVTTPPAATRPTNRSAEETLRQMLRPQGESARPLRPVEPEQPPATDITSGPGAVAPGAPPRPVVREGTLLLDRLGRLTRSEDGQSLELTLDSDGRAMADPPMILLPNRRLQQLEARVQGSYRDLKVRVSGEVMEYRARNYLLLSRWSVVSDVAQPLR